MKTTKAKLVQSWRGGDMAEVREILKRSSKIIAMDFAVLIALTEGGESAARLLRLVTGYEP